MRKVRINVGPYVNAANGQNHKWKKTNPEDVKRHDHKMSKDTTTRCQQTNTQDVKRHNNKKWKDTTTRYEKTQQQEVERHNR